MSFYERDGEVLVATANTRGPWHPDLQHAGPPCALLLRAVELEAGALQIVRVTVDLLKPVPITRLVTAAREVVPGRRRRILEAELRLEETGQVVAVARALLLRREEIDPGELAVHDGAPPPPPGEADLYSLDIFSVEPNYNTSMELRLATGGPGSGRARMWMRQRLPLVSGETPSPLQRLMVVADSGNGVSIAVDKARYNFTNPDLTVNVRRPPEGEWLCLDAHTHFQGFGLGMAESRLWDASGVVANGTQNLLLERVPEQD